MPTFMVRCYQDAKPQAEYQKIQADSPHEAAEKHCGVPLNKIQGANPGNLRAVVMFQENGRDRKLSFAARP